MYNLFILLPNLSDEEVKVMQSQIKDIIKKVDGKIENVDEMGKRKLSYPIKKVRQGFYLNYVLDLDKDNINKLKKELKLNQGILRFELSFAKPRKTVRKTTRKIKKDKKDIKDIKEIKKERPKISMEELDKKLDNILETKDI